MRSLKAHSDHDLLAALRQGDAAAFRELYDRYWQRLIYFAVKKTNGDMAEAENMVQDVFVSLWHRRENLVIKSSLEAYLVASVKYRVIKWLNRHYTESLYDQKGMVIDILDNSTQEYLALEELQSRLELLLQKLPEKAQLIYRLSRDEEKSHREIADEMGMTETAVNVTLVRTRKTLRTGLGSFLTTFLF